MYSLVKPSRNAWDLRISERWAEVRPESTGTPPSTVLVDTVSKFARSRYEQPRKFQNPEEKDFELSRRTRLLVPTEPTASLSKGARMLGRKVVGQKTWSSQRMVIFVDT